MTEESISHANTPPESDGNAGIHQLGYRSWNGTREPDWTRWIVICGVGARRAWQNNWLKRMLFFAWLPAIWFGVAFFLWEQAALYPDWGHILTNFVSILPPIPVFNQLRESTQGDLVSNRHVVWSWLLNSFFRYPQAVLMLLMVGLIAPPLISQDIRSRAFLLYFSRPLTRAEYLLGKMATVWAYLAMITAVPALALYGIGIVLSPSLSVVASTWDLPLRILGASLVLLLPTSALALCLSSLTQETRYAGFAWFAVWILGWFTYISVSSAQLFGAQRRMIRHGTEIKLEDSVWTHLSMYHTLDRVQNWVFGFDEFKDVYTSVAILVAITVVSILVLFRQISAPMRV